MTLLAAYSFDEASGSVLDVSGNGHDFALATGFTRSSSGHTNSALTSSTSGMLNVASGSGVFGQTADRTVMCWLKGTGEVWHIRWQPSSLGSGSWGLATLSGVVQVRARPSTTFTATAGTTMPTDGAWHHIAATYQESTSELKFYLDGTLAQTTSLTGPLLTTADAIDVAEWSSGTLIDDLRIYSECLTATAIGTAMSTPVGSAPSSATGAVSGVTPKPSGALVGGAGNIHVLALGDANTRINMDYEGPNSVTVPTHADVAFSVGDTVTISQRGSGKTRIVPADGVTITPPLIALDRYSTVTLTQLAADKWEASGDLGIRWVTSRPFGTWEDPGFALLPVNNNVWNTAESGPQTIYAAAWNNWAIVSDQPGAGTDDSVKSYADSQQFCSIPTSSMTSIPSWFDVITPAGGGTIASNGPQWNAAYDLWLNDFQKELMIWNNWTANWQYWYNVYSGVDLTIDGITYHAWNNGADGTWFVRQTVANVGSVDLAHIIAAAVARGWLTSQDVLTTIEYGFEVNYTGEPLPFVLNDFDALI